MGLIVGRIFCVYDHVQPKVTHFLRCTLSLVSVNRKDQRLCVRKASPESRRGETCWPLGFFCFCESMLHKSQTVVHGSSCQLRGLPRRIQLLGGRHTALAFHPLGLHFEPGICLDKLLFTIWVCGRLKRATPKKNDPFGVLLNPTSNIYKEGAIAMVPCLRSPSW